MIDDSFEDACKTRGTREAGAVFSACEQYRYLLWRVWSPYVVAHPVDRPARRMPIVAFIGLNPSTATESRLDPTVTRCINYAKQWGFKGMYMLNIHAFRSTDPKKMMQEYDPTGPLNDLFLVKYTSMVEMNLACWGNWGTHRGRGRQVEALIPDMYSLGVTHRAQPKHPLYLNKSLIPNAHRYAIQ